MIRQSRRAWGATVVAGILAGLMTGVIDGGLGLTSAGLPWWRALAAWCVCLGSAALIQTLFSLLAGLIARLAGGRGASTSDARRTARRLGVLAALIAAPWLSYCAFALFAGPRAARVPGHTLLSALALVAGFAGVAGGVWALVRGLAQAEESPSGAPAWRLASAALAVAIATSLANKMVLPRLYSWFHISLALATAVACLVAARAAAARPGFPARAVAVIGALALVGGFVSAPVLRKSAGVRFALIEKTNLVSLVIRALPLPIIALGPASPSSQVSGPALPDGPHHPNADVVIVTIDALRFDHVSSYGYHRPTTPTIDALARAGVRFERAYSQAPHTSFSVASMLTGKYFPALTRLSAGDAHEPVTTVMRAYGWRTAAFFPPAVFFVDAEKLKRFRDSYFQFEYVKFEYLDAMKRVDQIASYFETVKPDRAFVWLHLFEPHEPYEVHPGFSFGTEDVDRYDSEIAYADAALGKLVAYLRVHRPGAIIVVSADHGEEFDEHGGRYHGTSLYEEQLRVPLVVYAPGLTPHVVDGPVQVIDIVPTILGLLDIPAPVRMRGTDLGPWLTAKPPGSDRLPPVFAELENDRMVVWGREKLLCRTQWGYCRFFDLASDPREQTDLSESHPERAARLRAKLDEWLDSHARLEPPLPHAHESSDSNAVPKAIARGELGDLGAIPGLVELLRTSTPVPVQRQAARLLALLPPRLDSGPALATALATADPDVADWVAVAAARLGQPAAQSRLRSILTREDGPAVRHDGAALTLRAALALAEAGDATGVPLLARGLDACTSVSDCRALVVGLGKARDARAVPALTEHLDEVPNRRAIVEALGAIGDGSATRALVERLTSDEYVPVRVAAATALGQIGGVRAHNALIRSVADEPEPSVRAAARAALARMHGPAHAATWPRSSGASDLTPSRAQR